MMYAIQVSKLIIDGSYLNPIDFYLTCYTYLHLVSFIIFQCNLPLSSSINFAVVDKGLK